MFEPMTILKDILRLRYLTYRPVPGEDLDTAISRQRIHLQAYSSIGMPLSSLVYYGSLGFLVVPHVAWPYFLIWLLLILVVDLARAAFGYKVRREIATLDLAPSRRRMACLDVLAGAVYGIGGALLMRQMPEINMLLFMCIMNVVPAMGLLLMRASRVGAGLYSIMTSLPILWVWLDGHPQHVVVLVSLSILYWIVIILASGFVVDVIRQTMNIAQERDALVGRLEQRNLEAKKAMAGAQQAAYMRSRVLTSASHDLRQPMHALSLYGAVLRASHSPDQMRTIVAKVDEVIASLTELLQRLLELSQLISNQATLDAEIVELDVLVRQASQPYEIMARERSVQWLTDIEPVKVQGDAAALSRVIGSLLENAAKFTESGHIMVRLSQLPVTGRTHLLVEDTGIGISEADLPHVFEEYFQVRNQARNHRQGVGLGLAIARRLCMLMKADIAVESQPGKGTRFRVDFPTVMLAYRPKQDDILDAKEELLSLQQSETAPPVSTEPPTVAHGDELCHEYVLSHARAMSRGPRAMTATFLGMAFLFLPYVPWWQYCGWAVATLGIITAEMLYGRHTVKTLHRGMNPRPYHHVQCYAAVLTGGLVAAGWWLLSSRLPQQEFLLSCTILLLIPIISVSWVLSSRLTQMLTAVPIVLTICSGLIADYPQQKSLFLIGAALYGILLFVAATDLENMLLQAVNWRGLREDAARAIARSNSEIRLATERTAQDGRRRNLALAAASHDLRQPLHALSMCNATLSMNLSREALLKVIGNVNNIVRSLGTLLHRLLDVSRAERDALLIVPLSFELAPVLTEACEQMRPSFSRKSLSIRAEAAPLMLHADPIAVRRILGNLLANALKFTERGGVTVTCQVADLAGEPMGLIEVRDTGPGIPEQYRERVFDEYFQINRKAHEPGQGIGLGLSIVRRLSRMMGGQVDLQPGPDGGCNFRIWLPLGDTPDPSSGGELAIAARPVIGLKVLVIEDDESVADSVKMLLEVWGFDCHVAADGPQADAIMARHGRPDVILADLRLPGPEQGARIARRLSAGNPPCPVLIITGETSGAAFEEALQQNYPILQKPVDPDLLRHALHRALP